MLSPEQQAVLQELKKRDLSPQQKAIVEELSRRGSQGSQQPPSVEEQMKFAQQAKMPQAQPGGPIMPGMAMPPMPQQRRTLQEGGELLAEDVTKASGNPYVGAAAGTALQMSPDIAMSIIGGGPGARLGAKGAKAAGRGIARGADLLSAPSLSKAQRLRGAAMEKAGVNLPESLPTPKSEKAILEWVNELHPAAKKGAKALSEAMDPAQLNLLRTKTGHILDHLNVASKSAVPKKIVDSEARRKLVAIKNVFEDSLLISKPELTGPFTTLKSAAKRRDIISKTLSAANPLKWVGRAIRGH